MRSQNRSFNEAARGGCQLHGLRAGFRNPETVDQGLELVRSFERTYLLRGSVNYLAAISSRTELKSLGYSASAVLTAAASPRAVALAL